MTEEIFDVVDVDDRVIGTAPRSEVHARRLRHRAVHVLLFNSSYQLLLQTRSKTKDTFPGCYDSSASGHLNQGEDYLPAALRELHEELGITVVANSLTRHFKLTADLDTGWEFVWVYSLVGDFHVHPNPNEISAVTWMSAAEVSALIAEHPNQCARSFCRIFQEFTGRGLYPGCKPEGFPV